MRTRTGLAANRAAARLTAEAGDRLRVSDAAPSDRDDNGTALLAVLAVSTPIRHRPSPLPVLARARP